MSNKTHPIPKGARVKIYGYDFSGNLVLEGEATIVRATDVDNRYIVRFDGDQVSPTYERFVNPENVIS